jgi:hypothetical protein
MTDTPTPYKATPEQWQHLENGALSNRPYNSARAVLTDTIRELRDRLAHLEQQHETAKACIAEIYERLDRLKLKHESNWVRIVKLEEAQDAAAADDGELPEEVAALIPWLLEEAAQAANAGRSTAAGLLTLAAQLLGERGTTLTPVPVSERPWERGNWCNKDGECWWCPSDGPVYWSLAEPAMVYGGWLLPAHALPLPEVKS